ncbi:DMT family transporter [Gordonia sp. NPDC003424]
MHSWLPALLALIAALLIATGSVMRQRASHASGAIRQGWWLGAVVALCGFAFQVAALGLGPILLVQPLVTFAVLFALPLEAWADHRRPMRIEWIWGAVLVVCVTVFLTIAQPEPSDRRPNNMLTVIIVGAIVGVLVCCVIVAERSNRHYRALLYGVVGGMLFGMSAILVKTVVNQSVEDGLRTFVQPGLYLFLVVAGCAIVAQQRGFGAGELQTSFPALTVTELVASMALGIALLGENIAVSVPTALFLGVVLAAIVRAVLELARHAGERAEHIVWPDGPDPISKC